MSPSDIQIEVFGKTDVGLIREHNEDNLLVADLGGGFKESELEQPTVLSLSDRGALFLVCDGMGGAAAGEDYDNEWDGELDQWHGPFHRQSIQAWFAALQYRHIPADALYLRPSTTPADLARSGVFANAAGRQARARRVER